jgi:hypothetical protein
LALGLTLLSLKGCSAAVAVESIKAAQYINKIKILINVLALHFIFANSP